jgi:hypothetical protein
MPMDDIDFSKSPQPSSQSISRSSAGVQQPSTPVFNPGYIEDGKHGEWPPEKSLQLSQEQAERLEENRTPGDVKYVMKVIEDPEQYLKWREGVIEASYVDYRRIHRGNLRRRLRLHTGEYDVPSGRKNPKVDHGEETPFEVNLQDFRLRLQKSKPVFQVIYYDWSHADEDGGPGSSSLYSKRVDERPDGWISVAEVSNVKDQTQSAITRAIRHGKLTAVMEESPKGASQKRWVKPDEKFEQWNPGRQKNYLLRRRLKLMKEVIFNQLKRPRGTRILSLPDTMDRLRKKEVRNFGSEHVPESYGEFFEESLDRSPSTMREWVKRIGSLAGKYCR